MSERITIPAESLSRLTSTLLRSRKVREDVAHHVHASLMQTSLRGVDSHGLELLPHYIRAVEAGRLNPAPRYRFEATGAATGCLDADHTFGHAAGAEGMEHAVELARSAGAGVVTVYNSSHFGAAAYFALLAADQGFIAMSFTHADSLMRSHGGTRPFFGTNPICFAAPCEGEDPFCLDMATTLVSWNKVLHRREDGEPLGSDWAFGYDGEPTTDAEAARMLSPIGLYKGFGLSMMIEILCGVLTGMPVGRQITRMYADPIEEKRRLGHCFVALDPERFLGPGEFRHRMKNLIDMIRAEPVKAPAQSVMAPGDPEKVAFAKRSASGIPLSASTYDKLCVLAVQAGEVFP